MDASERLLNAVKGKGLGGAVITSAENRRYFSGFTGSNGMLLIAPDGFSLITDFRYREQAKLQAEGFEVTIAARSEEPGTLRDAIAARSLKAVGFESERVSYAQYERLRAALGVELVPVDDDINALRAIKSEGELNCIREAARIADAVFAHMLTFLRPGMTEIDAAAEIEYQMKKRGAEGAAFPAIVASGENGALPHAEPSQKKLQNGELVVIDFGARVNGYCSDMTRTVALGHISSEAKAIYTLVLQAQEAALDALRPGLSAKDADETARELLRAAGYAGQFGHGLGHGVGINVHEAPTLNGLSRDVLAPGMVVTVEPGIYLPGKLGVRIEDLCAVCEDGLQNFTSSTKEIVIL